MLAVIRVFTTNDPDILNSHSRLISDRYGLETRTYCIPEQPFGIYDEATALLAVPKIVAVARQAQAEGAKAVLISCAADPAVEECRQVLSIPVIGAGASGAAMGLALGSRVGVLNLSGPTPARMARVLGTHLTAEISPRGIKNTTDLLLSAGRQAAAAAAEMLARQADVIVLACTGYATIGLAPVLRGTVSIPVVDAVEAGGAVAFQLLAGAPAADMV